MATATLSDPAELDTFADDDYIPLDKAPKHIPGRPHRATVWRFHNPGILRGGIRHRLRTIVSGGRRYTRLDWIQEFLAALNADNPTQQPAPAMTPNRRQRQAAAAMTALKAMGVGN